MPNENLLIVQGGGPTAVFNASLSSIITEGLKQPRVGAIFGARWGMKGLSEGDVLALHNFAPSDLLALRNSPGAALGSSRFRPTEEDLARCVGHLRRLDIRHLIFMGGNGTMRGAEIVRQFCAKLKFDIQIVGVPKTIDNDIPATDRCPGFASAARFVAQSTLDLQADVRSLPQPVSIFETLGRDVGWLSASSTLAKRDADDAPHLVYVPEVAFSESRFLADLDRVVTRTGWAIVVVSEGIMHADGTAVFEQKVTAWNNVASRPLIGGVAQYLSGVVAENLGIRCRSEKPGLIGRSCMAHVSAQDREDAELVGRQAVQALLAGKSGHMVSLRALNEGTPFKLIPLSEAAAAHRPIPSDWLSGSPLAVTDEFRKYVSPLIGSLCDYSPLFSL
jgi:6-phosphofructokinase